MAITTDVEFFPLKDWKHPELIDPRALRWLVEVRREFGEPIVITDDARPPGNRPTGSSATSLHFLGRAFDLRIRAWSWETLWRFVRAVMTVQARMPAAENGVELEVVWSSTDKHAHIGFYLYQRLPRLVISGE